MKKALLLCFAIGHLLLANAATYDYLILEGTDGTTTTLNAKGLSITFANGNLIANDGTTVVLGGLKKMYFSNTSAIALPQAALPSGRVEVFAVSGARIGSFESASAAQRQLGKGLYLMKSAQGTTKIAIR